MAAFETELKVVMIAERRWRLAAPLVYVSDLIGRVEVPEGFETDFASVPRLPFAFWLTGDTSHAAAVVHDWLCAHGDMKNAVKDAVFREAQEASGVSWWRRWLMFGAVRAADWVGMR